MFLSTTKIYNQSLSELPMGKLIINTLNAHCFIIAQSDSLYQSALSLGEVLLPDGISVVWAMKWLTGQKIHKIAGADLFFYEMKRLQLYGGKCFFLGSSPSILQKIEARVEREYANVTVMTYSPPYKEEFSMEDNSNILQSINGFKPDVLFIGMTAPKQEKWAYTQYEHMQVGHICCIGAVFDFYAGSIQRAPQWMIQLGLEWLYRLIREPRRMWRRYLIGNLQFIWSIIKEKTSVMQKHS